MMQPYDLAILTGALYTKLYWVRTCNTSLEASLAIVTVRCQPGFVEGARERLEFFRQSVV